MATDTASVPQWTERCRSAEHADHVFAAGEHFEQVDPDLLRVTSIA